MKSKIELGNFEGDPRSEAGAQAIALLNAQTKSSSQPNPSIGDVRWGLVPDLDPRVVATRAMVREERRFDSFSQRTIWTRPPRGQQSRT